MKYLKIHNDGEIDIRLVALMGGTTKANDKYKIGQFGSGLKYTLAYLFRNNIAFRIFSGKKEIKIHTEEEVIRGETFEIICINGQRTSITTRMGEDWSAWMIIRELWCNALDEGGAQREVTNNISCAQGTTIFYIQLSPAISEVLDNWSNYFIEGKEPMFDSKDYKIYRGGEAIRLYKNGVLIYENKEIPSLFSYDISNAEINELREFKGAVAREITQALSRSNKTVASHYLNHLRDYHYEAQMDYEWYLSKWSEEWREAIGDNRLIYKKALEDIKAKGIPIAESDYIVVPKAAYKNLTKHFSDVGGFSAGKNHGFIESHDTDMEDKVNEAIGTLEECGYKMHPSVSYVYGFFEDTRVLAKADLSQKKVFISLALLQKSSFELMTTLVEENEHIITGLSDHTREFQQHFIDLYTNSMLKQHALV